MRAVFETKRVLDLPHTLLEEGEGAFLSIEMWPPLMSERDESSLNRARIP